MWNGKTESSVNELQLYSSPQTYGDPHSYVSQPPPHVKRNRGIKRFLPFIRNQHDRHGRRRSTVGNSSTAHHWSRNGQRVWLFFQFFWRWLVTVGLCLATAGVMFSYEKTSVLNTDSKHVFNFIVTGLFIGIGVNLGGSLSHFAEQASWLFLSLKSLPPELFGLVMEIDKQTKVIELAWKAKGRWKLRLACFGWILLMLAAQIGPALLGLTYQLTNSIDINGATIESTKGNASIADLSYILPWTDNDRAAFPEIGSLKWFNVQRAAANAYGQSTSNWDDSKLTSSGESDFANAVDKFTNYYSTQNDHIWNWLIRFYDYLPKDRGLIDLCLAL